MKGCGFLFFILLSVGVQAHGDDDHEHDAAPATATRVNGASPRIELTSEQIEIVAVFNEQRLELFVDDWRSNQPIDNATVTVQWQQQSVDAVRVNEGVYRTSILAVPDDHRVALLVGVQSEAYTDLLETTWALPRATEPDQETHWPSWLTHLAVAIAALLIGFFARTSRALTLLFVAAGVTIATPVRAHGDDTHGEEQPLQSKLVNADEKATRLADGSLFVPKTVQRLLAVRTQFAEFSASPFNAKLPAQVQYDGEQRSVVPAPFQGRVATYKNRWPTPGQTVKKGQVLMTLQAQLSATEQIQLDAQLARLNVQLTAAQARWERIKTLTETLSQKELEQAKAELDGLRAERDTLHHATTQAHVIRAPNDGVLSQVHVVNGQPVNAGSELVTLLSGSLTVLALAPSDFQVMKQPQATLVSGQRRVALEWIGQAGELRDQQRPLWFRLKDSQNFAVGDSGQVLIETDQQQNGVTTVASAIVRADDGSKAVLVKRSAEIFRLQTVHVQPLGNGNVLLLSGVKAGERLVTEGAALLAQLR